LLKEHPGYNTRNRKD